MSFKKIITPILLLIIVVLGIMHYRLIQMNNALIENKNFNFEWNQNQEAEDEHYEDEGFEEGEG